MPEVPAPSEVLAQIQRWFGEVKLAGLELPSGWFGRPHGDLHELTWSATTTQKVLLELDGLLLLTVTEPALAEADSRRLVIPSFAQLVFDWQEFGNRRPHAEIFTIGSLRLWAQG